MVWDRFLKSEKNGVKFVSLCSNSMNIYHLSSFWLRPHIFNSTKRMV